MSTPDAGDGNPDSSRADAGDADALPFSEQLLASITSGSGVDGVVAMLRHRVQAPVAVIDLRGSILSQAPNRTAWPVELLLRWRPGSTLEDTDAHLVVPIELDGDVIALLCSPATAEHLLVLRFAANIAALELGRLQAMMAGRRELVAQLLEDIRLGAIPDWDAARRLTGFGVDVTRENQVILGQADCPPQRLRSFPWNLHLLLTQRRDPYLRATLDDGLALVVPAGGEVDAVARLALSHLSQLGPRARVGVSGPHEGVSGLRVGFMEAADAVAGGPGINHQRRINLGVALMSAHLDRPMYELAAQALRPLLDYDAEHGGQLVETLDVFLRNECATGPAAEELFVHRNTLRYRLALIEKLTDRDLSSFNDRVHFWLATTVHRRRPAGA